MPPSKYYIEATSLVEFLNLPLIKEHPTLTNETYIYGLTEGEEIRYVGKADEPHSRYKEHHHPSSIVRDRYTKKGKWIMEMLRKKQQPGQQILAVVPKIDQDFHERWWVAYYKAIFGNRLTNGTDGGEGTRGLKRTASHNRRMSRALKGKKRSDGTKALFSLRGKQFWASLSSEERVAYGNNTAGWHHSEESKAAISAARRGNPRSEETKAKIAATLRGHTVSGETRQKIAEAFTGRTQTPEQTEKTRKISKNAWAKLNPAEHAARVAKMHGELYYKSRGLKPPKEILAPPPQIP